jgi:hypothetical protein
VSSVCADAPGLRLRVVVSLSCLVGAKLLNVVVPMCFKEAVDALTVVGPLTMQQTALAVPVSILLGCTIILLHV